ncbi:hypothetical protein ACLHDF_28825 [Priestia aryabhattai]
MENSDNTKVIVKLEFNKEVCKQLNEILDHLQSYLISIVTREEE